MMEAFIKKKLHMKTPQGSNRWFIYIMFSLFRTSDQEIIGRAILFKKYEWILH